MIMHETQFGERALLVLVDDGHLRWPVEVIAAEFKSLVASSGIEVVDLAVVKRREFSPSLYIGTGKADEIAVFVKEAEVDVVIFNNDLKASQQRNLEDIFQVKTIDRTQLILDIFALHAHTQEGKLQVELAQLNYLLPRLKGKGVMLSRLGGGIGTRGPGETKLELDRRKIAERIVRLESDLENVRSSRETMRKKRRKEKVRLCSLVGYTSAGKSTLFNTLTKGDEKTAATLFTTLDTVTHFFIMHGNLKVLVGDTVGFIHDLPLGLVESFKATLEELEYADLLLHVVDCADKEHERLLYAVEDILKDLKLEAKPLLRVFNKIDLLDNVDREALRKEWPDAILVSAKENINLDGLREKIYQLVFGDLKEALVAVPFTAMDSLDYIHKNCEILKTDHTDKASLYLVKAKLEHLDYLRKKGLVVKEVG
jgi:GTP-binding protein HflX